MRRQSILITCASLVLFTAPQVFGSYSRCIVYLYKMNWTGDITALSYENAGHAQVIDRYLYGPIINQVQDDQSSTSPYLQARADLPNAIAKGSTGFDRTDGIWASGDAQAGMPLGDFLYSNGWSSQTTYFEALSSGAVSFDITYRASYETMLAGLPRTSLGYTARLFVKSGDNYTSDTAYGSQMVYNQNYWQQSQLGTLTVTMDLNAGDIVQASLIPSASAVVSYVPAPGAFSLTALALGLAGWYRRKRRK